MIFTTDEVFSVKELKRQFIIYGDNLHRFYPKYGSWANDIEMNAIWSPYSSPPTDSRILVPKEFC